MWNYLPKVRKTIRVPPSMMMGAWMGSDFTNDDLMRESSWETDYTITVADPTPARPCLAYTPKPEAPVTWSKVLLCFDGASSLPVEQVWFDEKGRKARTMTFTTPKTFGARTVPSVLTMRSLLKPEQWTRVEYVEIDFGVAVTEADFSQAAMRRSR